jgi:hypothetical protein
MKDIDYLTVGVGSPRGRLLASTNPASPPCGTNFLLNWWGQPDKRSSLDGGISIWTYQKGLKWVGVLPIIVIPLPLPSFLPISQEKINFGIKADQVIFIKHETTSRTIVYLPAVIEHEPTVGLVNGVGVVSCSFKKIGEAGNRLPVSRE